MRLFLEQATEEESKLFSEAVSEALGPLDRPRYVIPRVVDQVQETFLSNLLPEIVGQYFRRRRRQMAMLHAVPAVLAKNKDLVAVYQKYWNQYVSPGEAVYAFHGAGQEMVDEAKAAGQVPAAEVREKEIFM